VLVNQFECKNEPHVASFSHQSTTNTPHRAALEADFFADDKFAIRLEFSTVEARAQKLDLGGRYWDSSSACSHDLKYAGRLKDPRPFSGIDMYKQISRKEWQDKVHALAVRPDPGGLVGRQK